MNKLIHDPEFFVAKTLDDAISKLHRLNELSNHRDDWGRNIYMATKDLEEEYQEDFIRYLANPAGVTGNIGDQIEKQEISNFSERHPKIDENLVQTYTLSSTKKSNEYTVTVTNNHADDDDDEKK